MSLPDRLARRLRLPLIVAPMLTVSSPQLVIAACRAGAIGAFPTANCRTVDELDDWLARFAAELTPDHAPWCANLVIRRADLGAHLDRLLASRVEMVITSVGSPKPVVGPLHEAGALVFADVSTLAHARKAIDAGVDGLVLLSAGAGGQTGSLNGLAFARAVRQFYAGPLVLAGGIGDGAALWAAIALGCDLGYMGTRFIASLESAAVPAYKQMVVDSTIDDIVLTDTFTGLPTSMLGPSLLAAGISIGDVPAAASAAVAASVFGSPSGEATRRWRDLWSAGHSVSAVDRVLPVAELIADIATQFRAAAGASSALPWLAPEGDQRS
ncbi:MAG: nitronate monooxygenase [Gammaproteobacteria bacterium]|nr:nitronate monooxygenase [Gammaproteobacteria bacterium]